MAVKLGWPVQLLQKYTTSKEFLRWQIYLQEEPNEFNSLHYYLASIAWIIARVNAKDPDAIKLEDFLLKFESQGSPSKTKTPKTLEEKQEQVQQLKHSIFAGLGLDRDGKPRPRTRYRPQSKIKSGKIQG